MVGGCDDGTLSGTAKGVARRLAAAGIEGARLEAELLVRAVIQGGPEYLLLHPGELLSEAAARRLETLTIRRAEREPLPYLLGETEFYSLPFHIGREAMIPRPETEILVEAVIARAGRGSLGVDVGTGSGAIAVALACHLPQVHMIAVDISQAALALARRNCLRHGVVERVHLVRGDLLTATKSAADFVAANLPYIREDELPTLQPEVRDFEPRVALDGGEDGLAVIRRLSVQLRDHLSPGGFAALEVGAGQATAVAKLLETGGLLGVEVLPDYAGIERVVIGRQRG